MIARLPSPFAVRQRVSASFETHMVVRWRDSLPGCSNLDLTFLTLEVSFLRRRRMNSRPGCGEGRGVCVSVYAAWNEGTRHAPRSPRQLTCRQSRSLSGGGETQSRDQPSCNEVCEVCKTITTYTRQQATSLTSIQSKACAPPRPVCTYVQPQGRRDAAGPSHKTFPTRLCLSLPPVSTLHPHVV